jgi:hypothetical protein
MHDLALAPVAVFKNSSVPILFKKNSVPHQHSVSGNTTDVTVD